MRPTPDDGVCGRRPGVAGFVAVDVGTRLIVVACLIWTVLPAVVAVLHWRTLGDPFGQSLNHAAAVYGFANWIALPVCALGVVAWMIGTARLWRSPMCVGFTREVVLVVFAAGLSAAAMLALIAWQVLVDEYVAPYEYWRDTFAWHTGLRGFVVNLLYTMAGFVVWLVPFAWVAIASGIAWTLAAVGERRESARWRGWVWGPILIGVVVLTLIQALAVLGVWAAVAGAVVGSAAVKSVGFGLGRALRDARSRIEGAATRRSIVRGAC